MTTLRTQHRFWPFTVSSIQKSVYLYFDPLHLLILWLLKKKARITISESWIGTGLNFYQKSIVWQSIPLIVSALPPKEAARAIRSIAQPLVDDMQCDVFEKKQFRALVDGLEG